jgi:rifampicin phosphotransferase
MSVNQFDDRQAGLVASLSSFRHEDIALAGGKGANLGELVHAGFNVPPGFIITTAAYDLLLEKTNLRSRLADLIASHDLNDPDSVKNVSKQLHDVLQQISISGEITDEVWKVYRELGSGAVAVRSSATAEDLPEAAFAGQQETFLNIIGEQALIDAVRACWMSLWSERAILYRSRQNVDQTTVKLAVVVQRMVPADAAGVMFTANPVSGKRDELIIDASPGLGEAVVSGMVTPDHFTVDKRSRRVKEQSLGRREVVIRPKMGGGTEQEISTQNTTTAAALPLRALQKLTTLGMEIERHYGVPQDVEWAWVQNGSKIGTFFILQARPMTALPEPLHVSGPMRLIIPMLAEMWPTRPYPLDMTTFTGAVERAIGNFLATMIGKSAPSPDESFLEEDGVIVRFKPPKIHPSPSILVMPWIALWRTRHYDPSHWETDPLVAELIAKARALEQRELQSITWKQNMEILHESLALIPRVMELREHYFPRALLGLAALRLLLTLTGHTDRFGELVSGVKTKTIETNQALEDLANYIRTDPALGTLFHHTETNPLRAKLEASQAGQMFLKQFELFLAQYGHRETTLTISQPAWKDQPEMVLGILKLLAETELQQTQNYEAWQRVRDGLLTHSILGTRFLRTLFLNSLADARSFFQIREDTHFYVTLTQPTIRRVSLEFGRRLVQTGALDEAADIFHLQLRELETFGATWPPPEQTVTQARMVVARRKALRESLADKPLFDPRLFTMISLAQGEKDVLLRGTPGSPGLARGPARVVHDISEFGKLRAGDVLVAPVTNPGWTPLFQRAAAVVVDTGGSASHAAIVAREYGVPAVMGTMNGTRVLQDGQWIQVDGSRGFILKIEEPK